MVGTVAIGRAMKSIFKSIPRKALTSGPETYGKWLSSQIGKSVESTAGEVFITTPGQVVGESLLAESAGVRDQTTWNEKGTATLDAMSIALGQSSFMTGSSIVTAGAVKTAKGDFAVPDPLSQMPPPGQKFDPEVKPGTLILPKRDGKAKRQHAPEPEVSTTQNPYRDAEGRLFNPGKSGADDSVLRVYSEKLRAIADDQAKADALYDLIPDAKGGKVIGTDIARELLPEYAKDREGKINFVTATGDVAHYYAKDRIWREITNRGNRETLFFTAGGVAAGKSNSLKNNSFSNSDLIFDGTLRDPKWAIEIINLAIDNGWSVRVDYVQRPIELVVPGAVHRANVSGRWGPIADLPDIHQAAQKSIVQIAKEFIDSSDVNMKFWLNDGLTEDIPPKKISLAEIDTGGRLSYYEDYGLDKGKDGGDGRGTSAGMGNRSGGISERRRRAAEAFRRAVESRKYETRILRLLVKGSPEYEQILENALFKIGDPY